MGKGKGDPKGYVAEVFPGRIIFEIDGIPFEKAKDALRKAGSKLTSRTKMVARDN
jgi:large subunit ribosomal protein L16